MPRKQSTRFATRLTICFAVPALLFATAVGVGVWGLVRTQSEFDVYMATNQRVAEGYTELYAQSLQEGQAIRNMLLDPGNPRAFDNLREGQEASRKAFAAIAAAVADEPAATAKLKVIEALREARETALSQVASVVTTDFSRAKALLVTYETPAWRTLRAELIEQRRLSTDAAQASHSSAQVRSRQAVAAAAALAVFALACGLVLGWFMRRSVGQELGGEPSQARDALKRIAAGDLSVAIASGHHPGSLMAELASTQRGLGQLIAEIRGTSDRIQLASTEVANGNADLSQRTELAAANLQQTAASMGDLTGAVTQSAATAVAASQVADKASGVAQRGGEVVSQVVATMTDISASSRKVSDIIGVIDGIAFQTNILALNAAVEAARAGDKGRGFAVVAQEVRHLAHRSSEAAREIKGLIGHSVERVAFGAQLVHSAGQTMSEILVSVVELRNLVNEISARSGGQSDGIGRVNLAVSHLDQMTQSNAALVEQSSAAAESLKSQANLLGAIAARFRLDATPIA